ncbi:transporter, partial [Pseudomonas sp. FW305-E2]
MERTLWVLGLVLICILAAWGMWVGWRHRGGRQSRLPELPTVPNTLGEVRTPPLTGLY